MEMHQIRYFLAVCSERNFTRAAKLCNVSQPSLTRGIQLLEAEFGGFLFHREHSKTHLTELGAIIEPHLKQVWEQTFAAKTQAHDFATAARAKLKLGIMCTIAPLLLIDLLASVKSRHPDIELQIFDGSASELEKQLLQGENDVAIYCSPDGESDRRLTYLPLFREQMLIAMASDHRFANQEAIRIEDLSGERYVRRSRCEFNSLVEKFLETHRIDCEMSCSSERDDWALAMISAGFGLGLFPKNSIKHQGVVAKPLICPEFWREVNFVTVKGRTHSRSVGAFVHEAMQAKWDSEKPPAVQKRGPDSA